MILVVKICHNCRCDHCDISCHNCRCDHCDINTCSQYLVTTVILVFKICHNCCGDYCDINTCSVFGYDGDIVVKIVIIVVDHCDIL